MANDELTILLSVLSMSVKDLARGNNERLR